MIIRHYLHTQYFQDTYASNMDELLKATRKNQFQGYTSVSLDKIRFVQTDILIERRFFYLFN